MATSSKIKLSLTDCGVFHTPGITKEAATKASEVLQDNHEHHHIFFNQEGFHNHIAHHTLTLYALGATPAEIQQHYDHNKSYQRPPRPIDDNVLENLRDYQKFDDYLGNERYYHNYLVFFRDEIDKKGYEEVIKEYVLKGDERADDMLVRLHAGFLHPIIHLGFGVEFKQPAIIAEGLAQAAVHDNWIGPLLLAAEKASTANKSKSLVEILDEIRADQKLSTAAHWDDANKIRDGLIARAPDEMTKYASQWTVRSDELEAKTAEMINAAVYFTGGAQHPPKQIKFDFYYMHAVNCSIFSNAFLKQPWLSAANKVRLLEWKGRIDLILYASRRSPKPLMDEIRHYNPNNASPWSKVFERVRKHNDDGHAAKLIRALAHGEQVCEPFEDDQNFRITGKMWLQIGHMAIDSVQDTGDTWVHSAGFDEAWVKYEDRPRAQL